VRCDNYLIGGTDILEYL